MTTKQVPRIAFDEILENDTIRAEWTSGATRYSAEGVVSQKIHDSFGGYLRDEKSAIIGPNGTQTPDFWLVSRVHPLEGAEFGDAFEYTTALGETILVTYFREGAWLKEHTAGGKVYATVLYDSQARATFDFNKGKVVK